MVVFGLLTLYAVFLFSQEKIDRSSSSMVVSEPLSSALSSQTVTALKPISEYADQLTRRDIFNFGSDLTERTTIGENTMPLPSNLKVVGVIIGRPSEVIVEDAQTQQTYFIKDGETTGPFRVVHASKESIGLEYQGQLFEVGLHQ